MSNRQSTSKRDSGETTQHDHLEAIFVKVTGTDELVEEQARSASVSREITFEADGRSQTLSESVSAMIRDDGLGETFADPETDMSSD
ncbi:hypothetical protein [Haloarcula sp. JP-L23]|uniref:hypothetical protein n=1 Tax=Haloarcula sp. JP-L23 TaxID=2716717 RepID=UPI00140F1BDB|nr:hypothetical protein G9465_10905 [Haloarcula sp. JP-L23]